MGFVSRAGAAALAEPADVVTENPVVDGAITSGLRGEISIFGSRAFDCSIVCEADADDEIDTPSSADSGIALEATAAKLVCGAGFGACGPGGAIAATGREALVLGTADTGFAGAGAGGTTFAAVVVAAAAGFAASFFRRSPRATRSVPFACSTLMGFVRTRFAPIRKALATPACPSTTATASAD